MKKVSLSSLLLILCILYSAFIILQIGTHAAEDQWDLKTYYFGAKAFAEGLNPYDLNALSQVADVSVPLRYVYPPITLWVFRLLLLGSYTGVFYFWLLVKCIVVVVIVYLWKRFFLEKDQSGLFYVFCLIAFNGSIYIDIRAGNIALVEQFLIWAAFPLYLNRRYIWFSVFILAASMFKITPIVFLLALLFSGTPRQLIIMLGSFAAFLLIQFLSYVTEPNLYLSFLSNVSNLEESGLSNPSTFAFFKDLFQLVAGEMRNSISVASVIVSVLLSGVVLYTAFRLVRQLYQMDHKDKEKVGIFLLCLVYMIVLPRSKNYSYTLLIVPSYFLMTRIRDVSPFIFLFVLSALATFTLPLLKDFFVLVWTYFPLLFSYGIFVLYSSWIFGERELSLSLNSELTQRSG